MIEYSIAEMSKWMAATHTDTHLHLMITRYLLGQSSTSMTYCLRGHAPVLCTLAAVQDRLGWDNFVEGRISSVFLEAVKPALSRHQSRMTPEKWCEKLITQLLQLTHKQWLFRNSYVH